MMIIQEGSLVSFEYTLSLKDGTHIETTTGKDPMIYQQGKSEIIPGLESQLKGMKVGETKRIEVSPEDGYGEVDPTAFFEVSKENFPAEALVAGTPLRAEDREGKVIYMRVHEVKDTTLLLNLNHPLAGETLFFDVRILEIDNRPLKTDAT
jgi:FKBP-type peptidyl-prolyl cis-trans isomerase SlyD